MPKVLFITTNNLTTNPRLLKEVKLAIENNFIPTVLCFDFVNWTTEIEKELRANLHGVEVISIPASRKVFISWVWSSAVQFICNHLSSLSKFSIRVNAYGSEKRSFTLLKKLNELSPVYDFIISHNLGALYPAYAYAVKYNIPFAFDIEDYHPGEKVNSDHEKEVKRRESLMRKLLPHAFYISYASPLIGNATLVLVPELQSKNHFLVNNSFSSSEFLAPETHTGGKVRIVWFSQNIASGRGLETVVPYLHIHKDEVQLTLIGNLEPTFHKSFLSQFDELIIYRKPMPQMELHHELSKFDVGLAVEISNVDKNRDIALSNKIFAYAQAGLYILATDTTAQTLLIEQNPLMGIVFEQIGTGFETALRKMLVEKEKIVQRKEERYIIGKTLAWEKEGCKLLQSWNFA